MNWRTAQGSALEIPQLQRPRRGRRRYHFPGFKVEVSAARFFKVTETERADLLYLVPFLLSIFCQLNCWEYEVGNATMIMIIVLISLTIRVIC